MSTEEKTTAPEVLDTMRSAVVCKNAVLASVVKKTIEADKPGGEPTEYREGVLVVGENAYPVTLKRDVEMALYRPYREVEIEPRAVRDQSGKPAVKFRIVAAVA